MRPPYRIGLLVAAALAAPAAHAQQTPTPTPAPTPRPTLVPGAERFNLSGAPQPARPQVVPSPTPSAVPVARPTASPVARPTAAPTPRATPTPAVRPTATSTPEVRATPTPLPSPSVAASPSPTPSAIPTPVASATPAPVATATPDPVPAPQASGLPWLWILLGLVAALAIGAAGWILGRRGRAEPEAETPAPARPAPPPPAPVPAAPRAAAPPAPAAPADPISIEFRPLHIEVGEQGAVLAFEMMLLNASGASADGLKIALLMGSANPGQDALIAGFHATPAVPLAGPPVDVPAGEGGRIPGTLLLEAERIHVVKVGERPMFVPIVMIDLRWRGGLTLRRQAVDLMVGTTGQGGKLGPIWLDRGTQRQSNLAAARYFVRAVPEAAA